MDLRQTVIPACGSLRENRSMGLPTRRHTIANSFDPDQTAPRGLFACTNNRSTVNS